jgi:predicted DNA-binding protein YlxM (UPF0122 family)
MDSSGSQFKAVSMAKRKQIDWEGIEQEYKADQLSLREIGRKYDVSYEAVRQKAKKKGWKKNLASRVQKRVVEKLVDIDDLDIDNVTDDNIVEAAAERGAKIVRLHRQDIQNLKNEEQTILKQLGDNPTKLWIGQYQGKVITKSVAIPVTERAQALNNLANVQHKRIQLERQAWNLNDSSDGETIEDILRRVING